MASGILRILGAIVMGGIGVGALMLLWALIDAAPAGWALWISGLAGIAAAIIIAVGTRTPRRAWGILALLDGGACLMVAIAVAAFAAAPDWRPGEFGRVIDLPLPIGAAPGGALLSAYLGIAIAIVGLMLLGLGYLLLHSHQLRHRHVW